MHKFDTVSTTQGLVVQRQHAWSSAKRPGFDSPQDYDGMGCDGMHLRFGTVWIRFDSWLPDSIWGSTRGERTRLLTGTEVGSTPTPRAVAPPPGRADAGRAAVTVRTRLRLPCGGSQAERRCLAMAEAGVRLSVTAPRSPTAFRAAVGAFDMGDPPADADIAPVRALKGSKVYMADMRA